MMKRKEKEKTPKTGWGGGRGEIWWEKKKGKENKPKGVEVTRDGMGERKGRTEGEKIPERKGIMESGNEKKKGNDGKVKKPKRKGGGKAGMRKGNGMMEK